MQGRGREAEAEEERGQASHDAQLEKLGARRLEQEMAGVEGRAEQGGSSASRARRWSSRGQRNRPEIEHKREETGGN
jgi:hypothetical protein